MLLKLLQISGQCNLCVSKITTEQNLKRDPSSYSLVVLAIIGQKFSYSHCVTKFRQTEVSRWAWGSKGSKMQTEVQENYTFCKKFWKTLAFIFCCNTSCLSCTIKQVLSGLYHEMKIHENLRQKDHEFQAWLELTVRSLSKNMEEKRKVKRICIVIIGQSNSIMKQ